MICKKWLLPVLAVYILPLSAIAAGTDSLFQVSTINALLIGLYDGEVTFAELEQKGDFGIGTVNGLDGELIVLDGESYHVKADGSVAVLEDTQKTPFATVTFFEIDQTFAISTPMNYDEVKEAIDDVLPTTNIFYAIKITGSFSSMQTRSVPKQEKPYRELVEVVREQSVFDLENVEGTIVALRAPGYVTDINVPGHHFHFLTQDKSAGGHVLDFTAENITIEIDYTFGFEMILPNAADFFAASLVSDDLDEVEKPKSNLRAYDFFK